MALSCCWHAEPDDPDPLLPAMNPNPANTPAPPLPAAELQRVVAEWLSAALRRSGGLMAVKEAHSGRYLHVNAAMCEFLGRPEAEVIGRSDADFFEPSILTALRAAEHTSLSRGELLSSEHRFEWRGVRRDFSVMRQVIQAAEGVVGGDLCICSLWHDQSSERQREAQMRAALEQIEQQQRANELLRRELADQALRDPASGVYTKAHFDDQLRRELDLSTREHREFTIVFIEIDPPGEKLLALGAPGQQRVLEAVGRLLRSGTRAMDASCRLDERRFAVLLSGVGLATAHSRMESLRRKCASQIVVHEGHEFGFTMAMGVASFPHTAATGEALVVACEGALAEARRRGGNDVTLAAIPFVTGV